MQSTWQTITKKRTLALVIVGIYVLSALFGMSFGMQSDMQGNMSNCPFAQQASMCSMNFLEHITKWQQLFTTVFPKSDTIASALFLFLALVLFVTFARGSPRVCSARARSSPILKNKPNARLFNGMIVAFSKGILHPKIYA